MKIEHIETGNNEVHTENSRTIDNDDLARIADSIQYAIGPHFNMMLFVWPNKDQVQGKEVQQISKLNSEDVMKFLQFLLHNLKLEARIPSRPE